MLSGYSGQTQRLLHEGFTEIQETFHGRRNRKSHLGFIVRDGVLKVCVQLRFLREPHRLMSHDAIRLAIGFVRPNGISSQVVVVIAKYVTAGACLSSNPMDHV